jgi:hypothetical protein
MTELADQDPSVVPAPSGHSIDSYADFGERVAGVLSAAETAAAEIREEARASADEILGTRNPEPNRFPA